jgi:hypothetical protein
MVTRRCWHAASSSFSSCDLKKVPADTAMVQVQHRQHCAGGNKQNTSISFRQISSSQPIQCAQRRESTPSCCQAAASAARESTCWLSNACMRSLTRTSARASRLASVLDLTFKPSANGETAGRTCPQSRAAAKRAHRSSADGCFAAGTPNLSIPGQLGRHSTIKRLQIKGLTLRVLRPNCTNPSKPSTLAKALFEHISSCRLRSLVTLAAGSPGRRGSGQACIPYAASCHATTMSCARLYTGGGVVSGAEMRARAVSLSQVGSSAVTVLKYDRLSFLASAT